MIKVLDKHNGEIVEMETREMAEGMIRIMVKWRNEKRKAGEKRDNKNNYIIIEA
jgi:hypothetical protein